MLTKRLSVVAAAAALLTTTACVTDPNTGEQRVSRAAIGAAIGAGGGYLLGDLVGGRRDRTERIIGTGVGAIAGGAIGAYMDRQEQELRRKTAGTGIEVDRNGDELVLNMPSGVTFAFDRFDIQPQFRPTLNDVAATLQDYPSTLIDVYGHTDNVGAAAYNQTLSENRARSVADYLSSRGVQSNRIATRGFGFSQPIADNRTEAGRAENRRVEIRIVPLENPRG
ncbi:Outer membrane protein OmpA [Allosphingosinicella indica]|uniref:Outer membrane protein OmpA n=2 Tax=Allosphingosinicella indica TaxID=941907 RepID=A0A1X7G081_9SPHN|nr:Outer membrane protein OmpA [Allosphingosinicella indica]